MASSRDYKVKDISQADFGRFVIALGEVLKPGLMSCRAKFGPSQPFKGRRITASLHITTNSSVLIETLTALGADVRCCSCDIISTQDHVAAAIARDSAAVFAWKGQTMEEYWWCVDQALSWGIDGGPDILIDDGSDAIFLIREGVKAEEEYEETGMVPDTASTDDRKIKTMLGLIQDSLLVDLSKYRKMKDRLLCVSVETATAVESLYQMHACTGPVLFPSVSKESRECVSRGSCFACGDPNHWKDKCPYINFPCPEDACMGKMKILTSCQLNSIGRKFMRCKILGCRGFIWLDEVSITTWKGEDVHESSNMKKMKVKFVADTGDKDHKVKITFEGNIEDVCKLVNKLGS